MKDEEKLDDFPFNIKEEAHKNYFKHFDRIHDKLFTINLSVLAGTIALFKENLDEFKYSLITPIVVNLIIYCIREFLLLELYKDEYHHGLNKLNKNLFFFILFISFIVSISHFYVSFIF